MPRPTSQAQKAAVRRSVVAAEGRRAHRICDSSFTFDELIDQALSIYAITPFEAQRARAGTIEVWTDMRLFVAWQLAATRMEWGMKDPVHDADAPPPEPEPEPYVPGPVPWGARASV